MELDNLEEIIFEIISEGGTAKSLVYEAMKDGEEGNFKLAQSKLEEADEHLKKAHKVQTEIITREVQGNNITVTMLFVHAQDHLAQALEVRSLAERIINIHKKLRRNK